MNPRPRSVLVVLTATFSACLAVAPLFGQETGSGSAGNGVGGSSSSGAGRSKVRIGNFQGGHLGASSFGDGSAPGQVSADLQNPAGQPNSGGVNGAIPGLNGSQPAGQPGAGILGGLGAGAAGPNGAGPQSSAAGNAPSRATIGSGSNTGGSQPADPSIPKFPRRFGNTELRQWEVGAGVSTDASYNYWAAWGTGMGMMEYMWGSPFYGYGMGAAYGMGASVLGPYYGMNGMNGMTGNGVNAYGMGANGAGHGAGGYGMPGIMPSNMGIGNGAVPAPGNNSSADIGVYPDPPVDAPPTNETPSPAPAPSSSPRPVPPTDVPHAAARSNGADLRPVAPPPQPQSIPGAVSATVESAQAFAEKGEKEFRAKNYKAAVYQWRHALLDDPQNGVLAMKLGLALLAAGQYDDAAGATQIAIRVLPRDQWAAVIANRKTLYADARDYLDQLHALDKTIKERPSEPALRFLAGFHYACLGYPRAALDNLDKGLKLAPQDELARRLRDEMQAQLPKPAGVPTPPAAEEPLPATANKAVTPK